MVLAAHEKERLAAEDFEARDFPKKNRVIAGDIRVDHVADHLHQRVFDDRHAAGRPAEGYAEGALGVGRLFRLREEFGNGLLSSFEHAHAKTPPLIDEPAHLCDFGNTHKHKKRVERN